jgi:hypothetical protein
VNSGDQDLTQAVRSWIRTDEHASVERIVDAVLAAAEATPQRRRSWFGPWLSTTVGPVPLSLTAAAAVVVALAALTLQAGGQVPGGPPASAGPSAAASEAPTASDPGAIMGLPPAGTTPSDPTPGELVLRFEPSSPWMHSWLLADGRLVTWRYDGRPAGVGDEYLGLVEQRLTASGVEFLTSEVLATGLFEDDLALLREGTGFLNIDVRNGDQLVGLGWGHRLWGGAWLTAPTATPAQAEALRALTVLLSRQEAWPDTVWADRIERAYVPSSYGICVRGVPNSVDPDAIWDLLPQSAQDLREGTQVPDPSMGGATDSCTPMTTDDARVLARILAAAGLERSLPMLAGEIWLRYTFEDPNLPGNELWISFGPVLPHGEAVWLGPG